MGGIVMLLMRAIAWTGAGYIANDIVEFQQTKAESGAGKFDIALIAKEYTKKNVLIRIGIVSGVIMFSMMA